MSLSLGTLHIDESVFAFILGRNLVNFKCSRISNYIHHLVLVYPASRSVSIRVWGIVYLNTAYQSLSQINEKCSTLSFFVYNCVHGAERGFQRFMSYISYQILHSERNEEKYLLTLLALTSRKTILAEMSFDMDTWLLKVCGEKEYHIISGYCEADCPLDNTFSGEESIVIGKNGIRFNMSAVCKHLDKEFDVKQGLYLCVAL